MTAFTVRLSDDVVAKLDGLAEKLDRSRSYVAAHAIQDYVARELLQLAEIEAAVAEADAGDFVADAQVDAIVAKYVVRAQ